MANELIVSHTSGTTVYAVIRIPVRENIGQWANPVGGTLDVFAGADWANYAVAMAELGTTGLFEGDMPAVVNAESTVEVVYLERLTAVPLMTDTKIAGSMFQTLADGWTAVEALRV